MAGEAEMWSMNKQELVAQITSGRASLDDALAKVGDSHMDLVILHGEWSVKDLFGHLAFWEETVVELFHILQDGKTPGPFPELDAVNAQALAESRKYSLADLLEREKAAYQKVLALINDATADELFNPAHFPWTGGKPFEELIRDNTCGHYEEHLPELIGWLKRIA
jgi:hypothetical protein